MPYIIALIMVIVGAIAIIAIVVFCLRPDSTTIAAQRMGVKSQQPLRGHVALRSPNRTPNASRHGSAPPSRAPRMGEDGPADVFDVEVMGQSLVQSRVGDATGPGARPAGSRPASGRVR